jgi:hypothetical protein
VPLPRPLALALLATSLHGCISYEYEHELWLNVDGSGTVSVTGRPELWAAFKGLPGSQDPESSAARDAARALFESSGLRVRRVALTHRGGRAYLFVKADFDDVNALASTRAFPDLRISLKRQDDRLILDGAWSRPEAGPPSRAGDRDGLIAVRFHLPSRIYFHRNATAGVERGNILSWSLSLDRALGGSALPFGASLGSRSIFWSTVSLFGAAIVTALALLALTLGLVAYRGRKESRPSQVP